MSRKEVSTKYPGVIYREHPMRKHGLTADRYFIIYYRYNAKNYREPVGWASEGMTAQKARNIIGELKENQRRGEPPFTLKEKRQAAIEAFEAEKAAAEAEKVTFGKFFLQTYLPAQDLKGAQTLRRERSFYNVWFKDALGTATFEDISELKVEKLKRDMLKAGRTARTVEYALAVIRQVWHLAERRKVTNKPWPGRFVKKPKTDNRRVAFFTQDQVRALLTELETLSLTWRDITLLSLHTGMRAGEIFNLLWEDIDFERRTIHIRDPKSGRNRFAYMTLEVLSRMEARQRQQGGNGFVFTGRDNGKIRDVSNTVQRTIDGLGFNQGVSDRRHKLTFHSCRHTFASWAAMSGVDMFTLQKLLGHETAAMTQRYSHLSEGGLQAAARRFEASLEGKIVTLSPREATR